MSDYFGDTVYEVWRRGGNPDRVERDKCRDDERDGSYPEETADRIVNRGIRRQRQFEAGDAEDAQ